MKGISFFPRADTRTRSLNFSFFLNLDAFPIIYSAQSFVPEESSRRKTFGVSFPIWINCIEAKTLEAWKGNLLSRFDIFIYISLPFSGERSNIANWCPSMMKSFRTSELSTRLQIEDIYIQTYNFTRPFYVARCCPPSQSKAIKLFAPNYSADIIFHPRKISSND